MNALYVLGYLLVLMFEAFVGFVILILPLLSASLVADEVLRSGSLRISKKVALLNLLSLVLIVLTILVSQKDTYAEVALFSYQLILLVGVCFSPVAGYQVVKLNYFPDSDRVDDGR